jgi:error-prone DNA polymerase
LGKFNQRIGCARIISTCASGKSFSKRSAVASHPATAKGITFVTLEDETGVANLIIRMNVWERFYRVARTAPAFIAGGRLQNQQGVIHILVSRLENLNEAINGLRSSSRDFH